MLCELYNTLPVKNIMFIVNLVLIDPAWFATTLKTYDMRKTNSSNTLKLETI